jgi:MurNAc alpha-1-phosphate uridylyltransferase
MTRAAAAPAAILLFAAGFGTRMGALTRTRPKPLIEVAGRPLIDHALALADEAGIARKVVNAHYRADQIAAHLATRPEIAVSREEPDILDTGGGLRHALPLLDADPVYTLNTDAVWTGPNPLVTLADAWDGRRMDALLMLVPAGRARGRSGAGDFDIGPGGALRRGAGGVYTGAQIISAAALDALPAGPVSLNVAWDAAIARGRLFGTLHPGGWCDVGHPGGIAEAEAMRAGARA